MKIALAFICSLLLAGAPCVPAITLAADHPGAAMSCCCDCTRTSCCAAAPASGGSQPVSAAPVPSSSASQNSFLRPALALLTWTLPALSSGELAAVCSASLLIAADAPLYERDCARLI